MLSPKRHLPYWLISITVAALYQLIIRPIYDRWPYVVALFGLIITLFIREVTPPLKRLSPYYGAVAILVLSLGEASSAIARVCSTISTAAGQESVFRLFTLHARPSINDRSSPPPTPPIKGRRSLLRAAWIFASFMALMEFLKGGMRRAGFFVCDSGGRVGMVVDFVMFASVAELGRWACLGVDRLLFSRKAWEYTFLAEKNVAEANKPAASTLASIQATTEVVGMVLMSLFPGVARRIGLRVFS